MFLHGRPEQQTLQGKGDTHRSSQLTSVPAKVGRSSSVWDALYIHCTMVHVDSTIQHCTYAVIHTVQITVIAGWRKWQSCKLTQNCAWWANGRQLIHVCEIPAEWGRHAFCAYSNARCQRCNRAEWCLACDTNLLEMWLTVPLVYLLRMLPWITEWSLLYVGWKC